MRAQSVPSILDHICNAPEQHLHHLRKPYFKPGPQLAKFCFLSLICYRIWCMPTQTAALRPVSLHRHVHCLNTLETDFRSPPLLMGQHAQDGFPDRQESHLLALLSSPLLQISCVFQFQLPVFICSSNESTTFYLLLRPPVDIARPGPA